MKNSINSLPIDQELGKRLIYMLSEFDSYRIGKEIVREEIAKVATEEVVAEVFKPARKKRSRSLSFLERLFITEYATS